MHKILCVIEISLRYILCTNKEGPYMQVLTRRQIEACISLPEIIKALEEGFMAYSRKETVIPPVAAMHFQNPPGDCHIKYGYRLQGKYYIVKVASGFPDNPNKGLPSGNGVMLLFDRDTGVLQAILNDEGYLTDLRTAVAGCIAAKYLAPKIVSCIGIVGTGAQAYHQLKLLAYATDCRRVKIWGRDKHKAVAFQQDPELKEWSIEVVRDLPELCHNCNLIVTTTSSSSPLIFAENVREGTHITAVGADDIGKQELDVSIFAKVDRVIVDSCSQCISIGDSSYAIRQGVIKPEQLLELGDVIACPRLARQSEQEITVADLTGVAIQDLQIAECVFGNYLRITHEQAVMIPSISKKT